MKTVLGEFSSGVSTCPNKGPHSDLGPVSLGPPGLRMSGGLSSGSETMLAGIGKVFSGIDHKMFFFG